MKLSNLLQNSTYELLSGNIDIEISSICYDSRKLTKGSIFVCLRGERFDSHDIIKDVISKGAEAVAIDHDCDIPSDCDITIIKTDNNRELLAYISAAFFDYPAQKMTCISITGTKGKTTSTHMIKKILEKAGHKVGMIGTIGYYIGDDIYPTSNTTPESYELHKIFADMVDAGCDSMVMEVSSQAVMMHRTDGIRFDIGAFTNIYPDHIGPGEHASFEEYISYKVKMFAQCDIALINIDAEHYEYINSHCKCNKKYTFGKDTNANYHMSNVRYVSDGKFVGLHLDLSHDNHKIECKVGLPGLYNASNALCALSICSMLGISDDILSDALSDIRIDGRMEVAYADDNFSVIIDYAHNAISTEMLLDTLRAYNPQRLVVVFGTGGNRPKGRRISMGKACGEKADFSIITSDNPRYENPEEIIADILGSISKTNGKYIAIEDRSSAIKYAIENAQKGDMIAIIGKGHENYQEICGIRYHMKDREIVDEVICELKHKIG